MSVEELFAEFDMENGCFSPQELLKIAELALKAADQRRVDASRSPDLAGHIHCLSREDTAPVRAALEKLP